MTVSFVPVSDDEIYPERIDVKRNKYLRYMDKEMHCTSRRCGSPTHILVLGMPMCFTHALAWLANLLLQRDEGYEPNSRPGDRSPLVNADTRAQCTLGALHHGGCTWQ